MSWNEREQDDTTAYKVVMNQEEQYSIWPEQMATPDGWADAGKAGDKGVCLAYIKEVWVDMRPLSLRRRMEETAQNPVPPPAQPDGPEPPSLVERLSEGTHPVDLDLRPEKSPRLFREAIERDYVSIKFTGTQGGTGLGFKLDKSACDFADADFEGGSGTARLVGELTVDYVPVRCVADIDLRSLQGSGRLVRI